MNGMHHLAIEADNGTDVIFVCSEDGCGRRVAVSRAGELVVVEPGDFYALHAGGTEGLRIGVTSP